MPDPSKEVKSILQSLDIQSGDLPTIADFLDEIAHDVQDLEAISLIQTAAELLRSAAELDSETVIY